MGTCGGEDPVVGVLFVMCRFDLRDAGLGVGFSVSVVVQGGSRGGRYLLSPLLSKLFLSRSCLSRVLCSAVPSALACVVCMPGAYGCGSFSVFLLISLLP